MNFPHANAGIANEMHDLLKTLAETLSDDASSRSLGNLGVQCDDLRRVRKLLIEDDSGRAKSAFRDRDGFTVLFGVLENLRGFYDSRKGSRDQRTEFFEVVRAVLDALSEAMSDHALNRRFFSYRFRSGGWIALESTLLATGLAEEQDFTSSFTLEGFEILFGILLAFAVGEEDVKSAFRGMQKLCQRSQTNSKQELDSITKHIQSKFSGNEVLFNPEILPTVVGFWEYLFNNSPSSSLVVAVPIALRSIQTLSIRNEVAMYQSGVLQRLLLHYYNLKFQQIHPLLKPIVDGVLKYGVSSLDEAYRLFHNAGSSASAARLVIDSLVASRAPPFVQLDLSLHGYSSIELPSLGQNFPPVSSSSGYTILSWLRFDEFDPNFPTTIFGASDASESCFLALFLDKDDRQIVLQTSVKSTAKSSVQFRCFSFRPKTWYHLAIVHKKPKVGTTSMASLFVDGILREQVKCRYPSPPPPRSSSSESFASITGTVRQYPPVHAFVGTPRGLAPRQGRNMVSTKWSMSSFHLLQEAINDELVGVYQALGPRYVGNFQDTLGSFQTYRDSADVRVRNEMLHPTNPDKSETSSALHRNAGALLPESKILINFSAGTVIGGGNFPEKGLLLRSLSKDASAVLRRSDLLMLNSAIPGYNEGILSTQGIAVLTGDPVVSIPQALDEACWRVAGGPPVVLKLLDMARTKDQVLRAVHMIFQTLEGSWRNSEATERENGYGVLAGLMREKLGFGSMFGEGISRQTTAVELGEREELALELLRMTLAFVGYDESRPESATMINGLAYRFLLVELDTWRRAPIATQKLYYSQFVHYAAKGRNSRFNAKRLIRMRIVKRFIDALKGESFSVDVFPDFLEAFNAVFRCSISPETLRSLSLYVTYALQHSRTVPPPRQHSLPSSNENGSRPRSRVRSSRSGSRPSPFNPPLSPSIDVMSYEAGVMMLEVFSDILCEPGVETVNRFAKTVTNKWLLFLLAEPDARVIACASKLLARLLVVHGSGYLRSFAEKTGGFAIMKQRLKPWWKVPTLWINLLAILFGLDPVHIHYTDEVNQLSLSEVFYRTSGKVVYPEVLPVLMAMLEEGMRVVVQDGMHEQRNAALKPNTHHGPPAEMASNAALVNSIIQFFIDLHVKSRHFRDYAAASNFVVELLLVLYPVIIPVNDVSAKNELDSRESSLASDQAPTGSENTRFPMVRTNTTPAPPTGTAQRTAVFRRPSSFIEIRPGANMSPRAKFSPVVSFDGPDPQTPQVNDSTVKSLLRLVTTVFLDQILSRKDFAGLGVFLKIPPGFQEDQTSFGSYILKETMSEVWNTLRMREQPLKEARVITNVARYVGFMADAIFEGRFINGADQLLKFIGDTLEFLQKEDVAQLKEVRLCSQTVLTLKRVFHRVALLKLSEFDEDDGDEIEAFLRQLTYWQSVALTSDCDGHYYLRFIFFLLYNRVIGDSLKVRTAAINFWRILLVTRSEDSAYLLNEAVMPKQRYIANGFLKLAELDNEAFLVWIDHNRTELDGLFLISLGKYWDQFVTEQNQRTEETASNRLAKRRDRLKHWQDEEQAAENHWRKHENATAVWGTNVHSAERLKHHRSVQDQQDNLAFTAATLEKFARILKAPCGLFEVDTKTKWRLDETEGQNRMRLRLVRDRAQHDEYQPKRRDTPRPSSNHAIAPSRSSTPMVAEPESIEPRQRSESVSNQSVGTQEEEYEIIEDPKTTQGEFEDKNRKVMRTLQAGDVILNVFNVSRIEGLEALEGLLIIGKKCMYLIDHYFQRADGEVVGVFQAAAEERDPYVQMISGTETKTTRPRSAPGERSSRIWRWDNVMLASKRRFLQRDVAIEVFFTDGRSYLLTAISSEVRNDVFSKIVARAPLLNNPTVPLHPEDQWRVESLRNIEDQPQSLGSKFASVFNAAASNPATKKWMRGESSNFAYLMQLNTMAGRTFNDLTQYPVFPWVIADYHSEELDLTDPRTFRDLSKPMGCQNPTKEALVRERYAALQEMQDEAPHHYATHYLNVMTVCQYLMRLQPFVKSYLLLQGGSFDHADRLFYSIGDAWKSAGGSKTNTADVRELTPEFFYLPEFLVNVNGYNFGQRQANGQSIDDVELPPWAKGDPHIFIQKHREALESPYVSMHLHKWIDLIFGFKQQGEAAVDAANVFHYLSYQGATDLDAIEDPHEQVSAIKRIHNFGQTPQQIFQRGHPQRDEGAHAKVRDLNSVVRDLTRNPTPLLESRERVASLTWLPKGDRILASGPFQIPVPPTFEPCMRWGFSDGSVRFFTAPDGKRQLALYENLHSGPSVVAAFADGRTLITAGSDSVVSVWNVDSKSSRTISLVLRDSLFGHRRAVSIVTVCKSLSTLLTADVGGRVLLWDLNRSEFVRELGEGEKKEEGVRAARISAATGDVALCSGRLVRLYSLNGNLLLKHDVCDERDQGDAVTACAWYEGLRGEWVERVLLFTGHRSGATKIWHKVVDRQSNEWTLYLVRRLPPGRPMHHHLHAPNAAEQGNKHASKPPAAITAILPMARVVYTGDESGRVYEWVDRNE